MEDKKLYLYKRRGIGMVAVSLHIQRAAPQSKNRKPHYIHSYHGIPKTKCQSLDHVADGRGLHCAKEKRGNENRR